MVLPMKIEPGRELALAHRGPLRFAAQLKLIFEDARLLDMTPAERQAALRTLASLLLEAAGAPIRELGDDRP